MFAKTAAAALQRVTTVAGGSSRWLKRPTRSLHSSGMLCAKRRDLQLRNAEIISQIEDPEPVAENLKKLTTDTEWARLAMPVWKSSDPKRTGGVSILEGHDLENGKPVSGRGQAFGRSNGASLLFGEDGVARALEVRNSEQYRMNGGNLVAFGDFELGLSVSAHNSLNPQSIRGLRDPQDEKRRRRLGELPAQTAHLDFNYFDSNAGGNVAEGLHNDDFYSEFEERQRSSGLVKTEPYKQEGLRHVKRTTKRRQRKRRARHNMQRAAVRRLLWIIERKKHNENNFVDHGEVPFDVLAGTETSTSKSSSVEADAGLEAEHEDDGEGDAEFWWKWAQPGGEITKSARLAELGFSPDDLSQTDDQVYSAAWRHRLRQRSESLRPKMEIISGSSDEDDERADDRIEMKGENWADQYIYPESEILYPKSQAS